MTSNVFKCVTCGTKVLNGCIFIDLDGEINPPKCDKCTGGSEWVQMTDYEITITPKSKAIKVEC